MANKKILVSNNSGGLEEVASSSVYYDDSTSKVIATAITASNITSSYTNNGFILVNNKIINNSTQYSGVSGSVLKFSDSAYSAVLTTGIGGDLSGSTDGLVKAISVSNVTSGTLPYSQGGTGLAAAVNGVLIKGSGNTISTLSASNSGSVIGLFNSPSGPYWAIDDTDPTTNFKPRIDIFTADGTWTKVGNPRFLRITAVAGGGGGGGGKRHNNNGLNGQGGVGGAGGGFSQIVIEAANITSAIIDVGAGGSGGSGGNPSPGALVQGASGTSGASTYVNLGVFALTASLGAGGVNLGATSATYVGAAGGGGAYIIETGDSANIVANNAITPAAGGPGYITSPGGGGGNLLGGFGGSSGKVLISNIFSQGPANYSEPGNAGATSTFKNGGYYLNGSNTITNSAFVIGSGGSGGSSSGTTPNAGNGGNGGAGAYGSGGGGGGSVYNTSNYTLFKAGNGGNGGNGYVIIESL